MTRSKLYVSVDETLKKQAQSLFKEWGMDMSTAVNMFLAKTVREQRFPFVIGDVPVEIPNAETIEAMEEIDKMIESGKPPRFETADDMFKELGI